MKNRIGEEIDTKKALRFVPKYDLFAEFAIKIGGLTLVRLLREDAERARMKRKRLKSKVSRIRVVTGLAATPSRRLKVVRITVQK